MCKRSAHPPRTSLKVNFVPVNDIIQSEAFGKLQKHAAELQGSGFHLKDALQDQGRCSQMFVELSEDSAARTLVSSESNDDRAGSFAVALDYSRQLATPETLPLLLQLAEAAALPQRIRDMFDGAEINPTERRSVLHTLLREPEDARHPETEALHEEVQSVLGRIRTFSDKVRSGQHSGYTGKPLTDVVVVGIGGSCLGPEFVHTALEQCTLSTPVHERYGGAETSGPLEVLSPKEASKGRRLRFLANVDPVDVARALGGLDPETTLIVVASKTFTTAETMLNARTVREWLVNALGDEATAQHFVACTTNTALAAEFGIKAEHCFGFWDWVGGRFSVCSAIGALPLALQYSFEVVEGVLGGAHSADVHFRTAKLDQNIPALLGLFAVWNRTFLGYRAHALLPYSQALAKFPAHLQQVSMESNGKGVDALGNSLPTISPEMGGEVVFGEPGTVGQHSFYQLLHQGTHPIPCEFVGAVQSQSPVTVKGADVSNHDELMSNFFAQPDALACGKGSEKDTGLDAHRFFGGNRPSLSLLFRAMDARGVGQLLAFYEHKVAVQGVLWGVNSFDQWGVELGKGLAKKVREELSCSRRALKSGTKRKAPEEAFNYSTRRLLDRFTAS